MVSTTWESSAATTGDPFLLKQCRTLYGVRNKTNLNDDEVRVVNNLMTGIVVSRGQNSVYFTFRGAPVVDGHVILHHKFKLF